MPKNQIYVSPSGKSGFSHIVKPNTRFKADGEFSIDLILEGQEAEDFKAKLDDLAKTAIASMIDNEKDAKKRKALQSYATYTPYKQNTDKEGEDIAGEWVFKFKNAAKGKRRDQTTFEVTIPVVDAKKQPIPDVKLGRGSTVKVAFEFFPYAAAATKTVGISLRLKAVQVLDLKTFGPAGADAFGEEEGYTTEVEEPAVAGAANSDF
jgi:hypothetical protein